MRPYQPTSRQIKLMRDMAYILFELVDNEDSAQGLRKLGCIINPAANVLDKAKGYLHPNLSMELGEFAGLKEDSIREAYRPKLGLKEGVNITRKGLLEIFNKL